MNSISKQKTPKASWVSQSTYSSRSNRSVERVRYLDGLRPSIREHAEDYFRDHPEGEQVTLACLAAVEESRLEELAREFKISSRTVKQDLGILVPLVLIEMVGPDGVETYRHSESLKNSTRSCPKRFAQGSWVSRYTPHRLTQFGRMRLSGHRGPRIGLTTGRSNRTPASSTMPIHLL